MPAVMKGREMVIPINLKRLLFSKKMPILDNNSKQLNQSANK
jgi:hypothetical protein